MPAPQTENPRDGLAAEAEIAAQPGGGQITDAAKTGAINPGATMAAPARRWLQIGATIFSLLILALSAFFVTRVLLSTDYAALRVSIHLTSLEQLLLAAAFTACSYFALTGYDACALRQLKLKLPYSTTALASFTSYAISFTLGFAFVTSGTVRYWIYSQSGLRAGQVLSLTLIAGITFWLGMVLVIGIVFVAMPGPIADINQLKVPVNVLIGIGAIAAVIAWLVWVSMRPRRMMARGVVIELPGFGISVAQIFLGALDLLFAAAALYVLLPAGHGLNYVTFAGLYVFGCLLGIASNAPGGIGAFEVTMLKTVPSPSTEALLASLVLFRLIYYFIPFVLAFALLGAHEIMRRWKRLRDEMDETGNSA